MSEEKKIFGGCELVEYKGIFGLVAVREYNGNFYQQWGRLEMGKEKKLSDKSQPFKVTLGNKDEALKVLKEIYTEINGGAGVVDEDVPF